MNKFILIFLLLTITIVQSYAQKKSFNTTLLSTVGFGTENSNDIWGYVDDAGTQYAVVGNVRNTRVFSLEDPTNPILRYTAPGAQSTWRDIKSYNKHLYVTTDQGADGLVIIDMTNAPNTISHIFFKPLLIVGNDTNNLNKCHNLYIDEKGFCYLSGCNLSKGGVLIFDLNQDPKTPVYVGAADLHYSHDNFARGDTLYSSEIYAGQFGVYDVTDRSNPVLMATRKTSRNFTHNNWPSDDNKYMFTTDERQNAYVDAYDISDLTNIRLLDQFRPLDTEGNGTIPHNVHYFNGYLIISWYTDGLRIVDAHKPDNLIEVAYYDTWEDPNSCHSGFSGSWGAFPFTDNDLVYSMDINNGLLIIEVDYKRAAYLEGTVTNKNGNAVEGVKIIIHSDQTNREFSDAAGVYKTGHAFYGSYVVEAIHPEYQTVTATVEFKAGEVTEWNIVLEKPQNIQTNFIVTNTDGEPIPAKILLLTPNSSTPLEVDSTGNLTTVVYGKKYDILITSWGYRSKVISSFLLDADQAIEIVLEPGIEETFETDNEWEILSTSVNMRGVWERAKPRGTFDANGVIANPDRDDPTDFGDIAFVTENGIPGIACADVDNGSTSIISPVIDLTSYVKPTLSFSYWFYTSGGSSPFDDSLKVYITNGETEVLLLVNGTHTNGWKKIEDIKLEDYLVITDDMRIIVEVSDLSPTGHVVEAGFDNLLIVNGTSSSDDVAENKSLQVFPNPSMDIIQIRSSLPDDQEIIFYNSIGQKVNVNTLDNMFFDISNLSGGIYFLQQGGLTGKFVKGHF